MGQGHARCASVLRTGDGGSVMTAGRLAGARILVIDDDPPTRKFIVHVVEAHGALALEAGTVSTGWEIARLNTFDLVLLDGQIGAETCDDFLEKAVKADYNAPIVTMSASADHGDPEAWAHAGVRAKLRKPFSIAALLMAIEDAVAAPDEG